MLSFLLGLAAAAATQQPNELSADQAMDRDVDPALRRPADYVVHEWGTFTSMVGTAGAVLEGLQREEEALPKFVHTLGTIAEWQRGRTKLPTSRVTQKMETPVLYFHAKSPLRVRVDVWFAGGLMTQFYPLPSAVAPELGDLAAGLVDMSRIEGSALKWDIDLVPRSSPPPAEIPIVAADDPWAFARQVDAAYVRTRTADTPASIEAEHYLFYRGLGRWQPRFSLQQSANDTVLLHNGMADTVPFVALLELDAMGGRFAVGTAMPGGGDQALSLAAVSRQANRALLAGQLGDAVQKALARTGLFADEARAMVATWSRSWFQKDGARVIYVLPRAEVEAVLPLSLQPEPKELVRTLVGRLEFITAAAQLRTEAALRASASADPAVHANGEARLQALDRFLEPHLRNVAASGTDAAVRVLAEQRLAREPR